MSLETCLEVHGVIKNMDIMEGEDRIVKTRMRRGSCHHVHYQCIFHGFGYFSPTISYASLPKYIP